MADPIHLIKAEAKPIIRAAYEEGRLLKQQFPRAGNRYRGDGGYPCAIGVLLPDEIAMHWDAEVGISLGKLLRKGVATTDDDGWFRAVQSAHDASDWPRLEALLSEEA